MELTSKLGQAFHVGLIVDIFTEISQSIGQFFIPPAKGRVGLKLGNQICRRQRRLGTSPQVRFANFMDAAVAQCRPQMAAKIPRILIGRIDNVTDFGW